MIFIFGLVLSAENKIISDFLLLTAYFIAGGEYIVKAVKNIIKGSFFDENFLMTLATVCAIIIGEFSEGVAVMLFYATGEFFQELAVNRSRNSVTSLLKLRPDKANILKDGKEFVTDPKNLKKGDILIIKPGEKIPVDCMIISGNGYIDIASLTGESKPKRVQIGDLLYSGTINTDGLLTARAEKIFEESTASKILRLVESSAEKKAKAENFITRFAKVYTPAVVLTALIIAFIPPAFSGYVNLSQWVYRALIFLIISCPCAIVISVPLGFFGGIGGVSKRGILFKGANYFDKLTDAKTVVFDKTGTLTKGSFKVVKVNATGMDNTELIKLAASCEKYSSHPIAVSLKEYHNKTLDDVVVTDYKEISGKGISATINGDKVLIGNCKLLKNNNIAFKEVDEFGSIVYVAKNNIYAGYIVISDEIKEDAYNIVKQLNNLNITNIIMLTGDNKYSADYVAKKLNIKEYYYNLLPQDKVKMTEDLKKKYPDGSLVFIGDGINDAPVLARADVGMAMGAMGSDAAIESADVVLLNEEVESVATAVKISRRTLAIVKQNIIFTLAIKLVIMLAGVLGIASMWMAVFADVGVAVLAILNSTRALITKKI